MNGIHRNADISYSSINPAQRKQRNLCCLCSCRNSFKSCFKCCMLKIPYGSITSTLISICGLVIATISLIQSAVISDRILYDLMHRKFLWFSDLKVIYIVICVFISVFILINLTIGFATTDQMKTSEEFVSTRNCLFCCSPRSTGTSCIMKIIFILNYLIYYILLIAFIIFVMILFVCLLLSSLCYNESKSYNLPITEQVEYSQYHSSNIHQQQQQQPRIDLRQFNHLLSPLTVKNDTDALYFTGNRLKMLCTDFLSSLTIYIILTTVGLFLLSLGFFNFLINLSVNWTRLTTQQKCAELVYINSAEMTAFGGTNTGLHGDTILESTSRY